MTGGNHGLAGIEVTEFGAAVKMEHAHQPTTYRASRPRLGFGLFGDIAPQHEDQSVAQRDQPTYEVD